MSKIKDIVIDKKNETKINDNDYEDFCLTDLDMETDDFI